MNKLSGMTRAPGPSHSSNVYTALLLAALVCAWPIAGARGQSALTRPQQKQAARQAKAHYVCPMHPEVKSTKPGKCPKCAMALRLAPDPGSASSVHAEPSLLGDDRTAKKVTASANANATGTLVSNHVSTMRMNIPDVELLDQHGNRVHFYTDLVKGKTIAINFIFTNCTTICPPLAATFARVQKQMGDKVGRDVHFISISVDPLTDTPERLKAWGAKFKAGHGWTFVTGGKEQMDQLLAALGASVGRREDHTPAVIIGNDLTGEWVRTYGLASPTVMVPLILKVMEGKTTESLIKEPKQQ